MSKSTALTNLEPRTLDEAMRFSDLLAQSDLVPPHFRGKPGNVLTAIQWGREVGLSPMQALQNIAVINGRPSIWGDAALALVRGSPVCVDVIETIEGDGEKAVATCEARRRDAEPVIRRFSVADAKKAGLWSKQGPWQQYPGRMLQQRARGFALRDAFPDVLRGVITVEEARDIPREPIDVTPVAVPHDPETGEVTDLPMKGNSAAKKGVAALEKWWNSIGKDNRKTLRDRLDGWKATARAADLDNQGQQDEPATGPGGSPAADAPRPASFEDGVRERLAAAASVAEVDAVYADMRPVLENKAKTPHDLFLALSEAIDTRRAELAAEDAA